MKEYVSEPLSQSKNSLESGERNLEVGENEVKEVKEGGIGLALFYLFAFVALIFAMGFLSVVHQCFGTPEYAMAPLRNPAYIEAHLHEMIIGGDLPEMEPAQ